MTKISGTLTATFTGINGAGQIAIPDVKVGDLVVALFSTLDGSDRGGNYYPEVTTDGYIEKTSASDQTGLELRVVLVRQ